MGRLKGSYNICENITKEDWKTLTTKELCEKYGAKHISTINKYARKYNTRPPVVRKQAGNSEGNHYSDVTPEEWKTMTVSEICKKYKFHMSSLYRYIKTHEIVTYKNRNYNGVKTNMATNILTVYLNDGFDEGFVTDLIDYIKNQRGTKVVTRENVVQDGHTYDSIKIERENHLSMFGGTICRVDPPDPNITVAEYGNWLCDMVDNIM